MLFAQILIIVIVLVIPLWRIFKRAGLNPAFALFTLIPLLGAVISLCLLAFMRWPSAEPEARR
jgi:hypothetical protein